MSDDRSTSRAIAVPASRMGRLSRLGGMTAGVAGNMALGGMHQITKGKRPAMRDLLLTPANVRRIANQLAEMRGAAMKVGQLVSMDTGELLPPELAQIMARLRSDAHFMPPAQLKKVLNACWPQDWLRAFENFDVRPIAAASIGQVHRATLKNGPTVAIKVQYPGVERSIDSDVANVGALIRMSGLLPKGFALTPYLEEARRQLHDETNYQLEAKHLSAFRALLDGDERFAIPDYLPEWSTRNILTMQYLPGAPIEAVSDLPQETKNVVVEALIELALRELFEFGLMQTDPNFANYRFCEKSNRIILLDFGATRRIGKNVATQYRALIAAGLDGDRHALHGVARDIGIFDAETAERHRKEILDMMLIAFDALRAHEPYDFSDRRLMTRMQARGMALAGDGFVPPPLPVSFLFVQRKLGGVFLLASQLGGRIDVHSRFKRFV